MADKTHEDVSTYLDQVSAFQDFVTNALHSRKCIDPVTQAMDALPASRRANVLRKLERTITEEMYAMDEKESTQFWRNLRRNDSAPYVVKLIGTATDKSVIHIQNFMNVHNAAIALYAWINRRICFMIDYNKNQVDRHCDYCKKRLTLEECVYIIRTCCVINISCFRTGYLSVFFEIESGSLDSKVIL